MLVPAGLQASPGRWTRRTRLSGASGRGGGVLSSSEGVDPWCLQLPLPAVPWFSSRPLNWSKATWQLCPGKIKIKVVSQLTLHWPELGGPSIGTFHRDSFPLFQKCAGHPPAGS